MMLGRQPGTKMTKYFLCSAKEYDFYLIAYRGGVSKFLIREATCALRKKKNSNSRVRDELQGD